MLLLCLSSGVGYAQNTEAEFRFVPGKDMFFTPWSGNGENLLKLSEFIRQNKEAITSSRVPICVDGYCKNLSRAKVMANRVKSELIVKDGMREEYFRTRNFADSYDGTNNVVVVHISIPIKEEPKVAEQPKVEEPKPEVVKEEPKVVEQSQQPQSQVKSVVEQPKIKFSHWSVGANVGIPFFWGDMVSMAYNKTYVGFSAGVQGGYRFSQLLGLGLSVDYAQGKAGARDYSKGYLLGADGMTHYTSASGTEAYDNLYSKISVVNVGLSLDVNVNRIFSNKAYKHRCNVWVSPTVYGQFFSNDIYAMKNDVQFSDGTTKPDVLSLGLGGSLSVRYRVTSCVELQMKNTLIWITDNQFDGIKTPYGKARQDAMWMPQIGVVWNINK